MRFRAIAVSSVVEPGGWSIRAAEARGPAAGRCGAQELERRASASPSASPSALPVTRSARSTARMLPVGERAEVSERARLVP